MVLDEVHWIEGPMVAGDPISFVFEVDVADGRRYRVTVREGYGDRVERRAGSD